MIRVADAAGAGAVLLAGDTVDPHNGKAVRASTGSVFHLPLARDRDAAAVLDACRLAGLTLLAADGRGELDLHDPDMPAILAGPTAWVFGGEAHGLPPELAAAADHRVRVPIHGRAESLNLATAAAVCLSHAHAERTAAPRGEAGSAPRRCRRPRTGSAGTRRPGFAAARRCAGHEPAAPGTLHGCEHGSSRLGDRPRHVSSPSG